MKITHKARPLDTEQKKISDGLGKAGLTRIIPDVLRLMTPSIRLVDQAGQNTPARVGTSRLGGQPDLPPNTPWPTWKGVPMAFVGQIRLEEVAALDTDHCLPPKGLLAFFYDSKQETYGADPDDRGGWQVLYQSGDPNSWQPLSFPAGLPTGSQFKAVPVSFQSELTLPSDPHQVDPGLQWSDDEIQHYEDWLVNRFTPVERVTPHHRLFGYPEQIQDDMQLESALASHGFHTPDEPGAAAAANAKADWLLLFQVDSDGNTGMRWGSAGMIYYWIEQANLKSTRFDQAWLVQQSD
jgi:uncharacterized protein YwqG